MPQQGNFQACLPGNQYVFIYCDDVKDDDGLYVGVKDLEL